MPQNRFRLFFLIFGGFFLVMSVVNLWRTWRMDENIWWTPKQNPASLSEARDKVEIYFRGVQLEQILSSSRLQMVESSGVVPLAQADITLRFNNRDRILAQRIPGLIIFSATAGASLIVLLCGLLRVSIGGRRQVDGAPA
jgi:hypothetical protein